MGGDRERRREREKKGSDRGMRESERESLFPCFSRRMCTPVFGERRQSLIGRRDAAEAPVGKVGAGRLPSGGARYPMSLGGGSWKPAEEGRAGRKSLPGSRRLRRLRQTLKTKAFTHRDVTISFRYSQTHRVHLRYRSTIVDTIESFF